MWSSATNMLQNPEALGKSREHMGQTFRPEYRCMIRVKQMIQRGWPLSLQSIVALKPCACHMQVGLNSSKIRCKLQILLQMLPGGPYTPNLETEWKKRLFKRQERKKPTHLHMYICTSSGKQISYEMDGQSCTTMLNSSHENPKVAFLTFLKWNIPRSRK